MLSGFDAFLSFSVGDPCTTCVASNTDASAVPVCRSTESCICLEGYYGSDCSYERGNLREDVSKSAES